MGESSRTTQTPVRHLPEQVFSSPTDQRLYPASTMAAVEDTRARFFSRQASTRSSPSRSRPHSAPRRSITAHPLSAAAGSYRQSFYQRCQHAMEQTRSSARSQRVHAFRKGQSEFTKGFFSDQDMDVEDAESTPSSPPHRASSQGLEEDDELTRRRILAEYSRLKRIYELKGHLEIGWIHPDQIAWLEQEVQAHTPPEQQPVNFLLDPLFSADDQQLEQLWLHSLQPTQSHDNDVAMSTDNDEFSDHDAAFEQALANLPI